MKRKIRKSGRRPLIQVFLIIIIVIITCLIVAIIIINDNQKQSLKNEEAVLEENPNEEYYGEYYKEVDKIYDNNPENIIKVVEYFTNQAEEGKDDVFTVEIVASSEIEWFWSRNINDKEALLDGLTRLDYSNSIGTKGEFYKKIITLAESLNKTDVAEHYKDLWNQSREESLSVLEKSRQDLENILKSIGEMPKGQENVFKKQYEDVLLLIEEYREDK